MSSFDLEMYCVKKEKEKEKDKKKKRQKRAEVSEPVILKTKSESSVKNPLQYVTNMIGGKWKIHVLWALREQNGRRYGEIKNDIPNITDMMLSQSLRELAASGLVERQQFQEIPPRVEYKITSSGMELLPAITQLAEWGAKKLANKN
jgi:DNA-binding HxlR family transcriptional regulator